jgi:hypothetical protein
MNETHEKTDLTAEERSRRVDSLRDMISSAEKTIQSAKAMLLQLEGKKKAGRRHKVEGFEDGSTIVEGTFDGQIMTGSDGKQYPVPANYASKSKLVEGDYLKLTITSDGSFIYKQIGPVERKHALGIVAQDENGNYYVLANGKPYRILLASVTYFRAEPGDEAAIVLPRDIDTDWAALENIVAKAKERPEILASPMPDNQKSTVDDRQNIEDAKQDSTENQETLTDNHKGDSEVSPTENIESTISATDDESSSLELLEEWKKDIEQIERELESEKKE